MFLPRKENPVISHKDIIVEPLGLIPINCLACSNEIIVPVQSQYLAAKGMTYLFDTVSKVRRTINPSLKIKGIVLTLVDRRTNLAKDVRQELDENYGKSIKIYDTRKIAGLFYCYFCISR